MTKPTSASGYPPNIHQVIRETTLYIATKLGDLRDECVIVGGLVPSLLVPQTEESTKPLHVGTMDVDLGLAVAILNERLYHEIHERLQNAGFTPDTNENNRPVGQRWKIEVDGWNAKVDFLIPPTLPSDRGGRLRNLEDGFAAIITPGLELAFQDRRLVSLVGETIKKEQAQRDIWVCEAGAFLVLKAFASHKRGENKDAYDLIYILLNYGNGVEDIFDRLKPLLSEATTQRALDILDQDFCVVDGIGPKRFAEFMGKPNDEDLCADAAGAVRALLEMCRNQS